MSAVDLDAVGQESPHVGALNCYRRGCRQPQCRDIHNRYCKAYRVWRNRNGVRRVDAAPYAAIVRRYTEAGWSHRQIAGIANVSPATIQNLASRDVPRIDPSVASKISRLPGNPTDAAGRTYVDAIGTIRRGRALYRIGHSVAAMAAELGMHPDALSASLQREGGIVLAGTARKMAALYERWARMPGPTKANRTRAIRYGWYGPMNWASNIDDPAAGPDLDEEAVELGRRELAALRRAEITHLASYGIPEHEIADRLGMARDYVHDLIRDMHKERLGGTRPDTSTYEEAA